MDKEKSYVFHGDSDQEHNHDFEFDLEQFESKVRTQDGNSEDKEHTCVYAFAA
jgi:hypothetical protein